MFFYSKTSKIVKNIIPCWVLHLLLALLHFGLELEKVLGFT